jgi:GMP synthase (glutamine-hydrolysing)
MDIIVVIDFGGQYAHLITRRVRDIGVYSEIYPFDVPIDKLSKLNPKGIILSGGPSSVYEKDAPLLSKEFFDYIDINKIPLLGLCYGHQLMGQHYGGKVVPHTKKEFGHTEFFPKRVDYVLKGMNAREIVWMSHGDQVEVLPPGFEIFGSTDTCPVAAMGDIQRKLYGFQFHPEVQHTTHGTKLLQNFIVDVCQAKTDWKMENWIPDAIKEIQKTVGENHVILGLSGGVDSTVTAVLLKQAIGDRVHLIFVNNGVLRKNEADQVCENFQSKFQFSNFHYVDAEQEFLTKLKGVEDPEAKRKVIGHTFIDVFERKAAELGKQFPNIAFLAQGTIYPDRVESKSTSKSAAKIKSHHNLTLPDTMKLKVLEPLRDLYKDEVRKLGLQLGIPDYLINRHPFPGPGLAVRCVGEVVKEKLDILRNADAIVVEEIKKAGLYNKVWQAFAVFLPVKSVGVMGDFRTYDYVCAVRIVESIDAMTANFAKIDWAILERISSRIINEVRGINRVVYDITSKPPGTIEFE